MAYDNVELDFTEEALKEIVKKAISQKTGARGLRSIVENFMTDIMFEAPSNPEIKKVTVTDGCVLNGEKPITK